MFSVAVPSTVAPSINVTDPVGVPAPGALALIVAVSVTAWPAVEGLAEDVMDVAVASFATACE